MFRYSVGGGRRLAFYVGFLAAAEVCKGGVEPFNIVDVFSMFF